MIFEYLFRPKMCKIYHNIDFSFNCLATLLREMTRFQPKQQNRITYSYFIQISIDNFAFYQISIKKF